MSKPSYISGYKFGTGMKQQQKHPIKLHMTNKLIFFVFFFFSGIHPPECIRSNPRGHLLGYNVTEELQYKTL